MRQNRNRIAEPGFLPQPHAEADPKELELSSGGTKEGLTCPQGRAGNAKEFFDNRHRFPTQFFKNREKHMHSVCLFAAVTLLLSVPGAKEASGQFSDTMDP